MALSVFKSAFQDDTYIKVWEGELSSKSKSIISGYSSVSSSFDNALSAFYLTFRAFHVVRYKMACT